MSHRTVVLSLSLALASAGAGCALGAGPWQPGRDAYAVAGSKGNILDSSCERRRAEHQEARRSGAYELDGALYLGIKQGVSWTRAEGGPWSSGMFLMELHGSLTQQLLGDRLIVGGHVFAAGYGSGDDAVTAPLRYTPVGLEVVVKLPLLSWVGVHVSGGPTYGEVVLDEGADPTKEAAWGARGTLGVDVVLANWLCTDVVLAVEGHEVRSGALATIDGPFEGRAVTFELVLGAH